MLAVAALARASAAIPQDEDTLCRGLRTSPLPGRHASVGDCWQNSRCCHLHYEEQHSFNDTLVSHPNTELSDRARSADQAVQPTRRAPDSLQRQVRLGDARLSPASHLARDYPRKRRRGEG